MYKYWCQLLWQFYFYLFVPIFNVYTLMDISFKHGCSLFFFLPVCPSVLSTRTLGPSVVFIFMWRSPISCVRLGWLRLFLKWIFFTLEDVDREKRLILIKLTALFSSCLVLRGQGCTVISLTAPSELALDRLACPFGVKYSLSKAICSATMPAPRCSW